MGAGVGQPWPTACEVGSLTKHVMSTTAAELIRVQKPLFLLVTPSSQARCAHTHLSKSRAPPPSLCCAPSPCTPRSITCTLASVPAPRTSEVTTATRYRAELGAPSKPRPARSSRQMRPSPCWPVDSHLRAGWGR